MVTEYIPSFKNIPQIRIPPCGLNKRSLDKTLDLFSKRYDFESIFFFFPIFFVYLDPGLVYNLSHNLYHVCGSPF